MRLLSVLLLAACESGSTVQQSAVGLPAEDLPLVAIWRASDGYRRGQAPYLRAAIWDDGRAVFAEDLETWSHTLREATIDPATLASLKAGLRETGVFDLEGYCYLVPDAPMDCVLVRLDGREQILYWDEVESPNYGINVHLEQRHLDFIAAWKSVNAAALAVRPAESTPLSGEFLVPASWKIRRPIQSR